MWLMLSLLVESLTMVSGILGAIRAHLDATDQGDVNQACSDE